MVYTSFLLIVSETSSIAASCLQVFSANNNTSSRDIPCTQHERFINYSQICYSYMISVRHTLWTACALPGCLHSHNRHAHYLNAFLKHYLRDFCNLAYRITTHTLWCIQLRGLCMRSETSPCSYYGRRLGTHDTTFRTSCEGRPNLAEI